MSRQKTLPKPANVQSYRDYILQKYHAGDSVTKIRKDILAKLSPGLCVRSQEISNLLKNEGVFRTHSETMRKASERLSYVNTCVGCQQPFVAQRYNHVRCKICAPHDLARRRLASYGLTEQQFNDLLVQQNNACAICKRDFSNIVPHRNKLVSYVIDHDHETKLIRGLLCNECNVTLGHLEKKSSNWLKAAQTYAGRVWSDV